MNFEKISLVFMFICIIALSFQVNNLKNNNLENNNLENFGNQDIIEHASNTDDERIKGLINQQYDMDIEAIRNLGAISKSLLTGKNYHNTTGTTPGNLIIPANVKIQGWAVAVPKGTVITWALDDPPPPNTNRYNYNQVHTDANVLNYPLVESDCWYPCIGGEKLGIPIPDLRGRLIVGQGRTNGDTQERHYFYHNRWTSGGRVPVGWHVHTTKIEGNTADANAPHSHTVYYDNSGGFAGSTLRGISNRGAGGRSTTSSSNATHKHRVNIEGTSGGAHQTHTNAGTDWFTKHTVPHYTVLQYWIRIR